MKKYVSLLALLCLAHLLFAQNKMRPLEELVNRNESAWDHVKDWIDTAKNKVEILSCDTNSAKKALYLTQVTTHSPMGAIVYSTGGLLIDNGWIRILGSGNKRLNRTLPGWNKGKSFNEPGEKPTFLLIADDAVGGFFAINGGKLGNDAGKVYYLSPDKLTWEPIDLTYSEFLDFCFNGDLNQFYGSLRWKNWTAEVALLDGDKVYSFFPYLWSKEGKDINKNKRHIIPVEEQYLFNIDARKQLGLDK